MVPFLSIPSIYIIIPVIHPQTWDHQFAQNDNSYTFAKDYNIQHKYSFTPLYTQNILQVRDKALYLYLFSGLETISCSLLQIALSSTCTKTSTSMLTPACPFLSRSSIISPKVFLPDATLVGGRIVKPAISLGVDGRRAT